MSEEEWHPYFKRFLKKPKGQPCASPDTGPLERERDSQSSACIKGEPEDDTVKEEINDAVPGTSASPQQKDEISFFEEATENFIKLIQNFIVEMKKLKEENTHLKEKNQALEEKIRVMKPHVVTPTKNTKLKNIFIIVKLNNENFLYHYCAICRQKISHKKRLRQLKVKHPRCEVILRRYCPNSINFLNLIKEFSKNIKMKAEMKGKISKYENKYFSLCGGYTEYDFLEDVKKRLNPS